MDYQVQLNNGKVIDLKGADFDATTFTATLNNPQVSFVNIGGAVINKHIIMSIVPVATETVAAKPVAEPEKQA